MLSDGREASVASTYPIASPTRAAAAPELATTPSPKSAASTTPAGGSAAPRPVSPGDNAVYRIDADGVPREVFRARALIYALAWQDDRLLVGTGPEGQLYEVRDLGQSRPRSPGSTTVRSSRCSTTRRRSLLVGAGDPGAVVRLAPGHVASGTLVSDVLDTKLISRFGALTWRAEQPAGTSVALQVRTGNVGEPDATWSDWSAEQTDPGPRGAVASRPVRPVPRHPRDPRPRTSPPSCARSRSATRRPTCLPRSPRSTSPTSSAADGATRQTRLTLRWDVTDPNGDDLNYTLHIRKEGWPDWVRLGEDPLTETSYAWDTTAVPAGLYRVRVTASDRPSNNPDDALTRERASEPFIVDHEAPTVTITPRPPTVSVALKDNLTRLVKAAYALDGGDWVPDLPRRRPLRHASRDDHDHPARPQAGAPHPDGPRHRRGGQRRHGRRADRDPLVAHCLPSGPLIHR